MRSLRPRHRIEGGKSNHPLAGLQAERLDREIKIIRDMGFAGYFLDHVGLHPVTPARHGFPVGPGAVRRRDRWWRTACASPTSTRCSTTCCSSASSTRAREHAGHRHRLLLPQTRAGDRLRHRKYGRPNVAQIITFGTMAARAVIRDVGRVLDSPVRRGRSHRQARSRGTGTGDHDQRRRMKPKCPSCSEAYERGRAESARCSTWASGSRASRVTPRPTPPAWSSLPKPIVEFAPLYQGHQGRRRDHDPVRQGRDRRDRPAQAGLPRVSRR